MDIVEIEQKETLERKEVVARLRALASMLAKGNELKFEQGGMKMTVHVPDKVQLKVELEVESDERELEIELNVVTSFPSGSSNTAPTRKQSAPNEVVTLATAKSSTSPVSGTMNPATAETANRMQPRKLIVAIFHSRFRSARQTPPPRASRYASKPATRKQMEPTASGAQTRRSTCEVSKLACIAR